MDRRDRRERKKARTAPKAASDGRKRPADGAEEGDRKRARSAPKPMVFRAAAGPKKKAKAKAATAPQKKKKKAVQKRAATEPGVGRKRRSEDEPPRRARPAAPMDLAALQRRLRGCLVGVRAEPYAYDSDEFTALEVFLMQRAAGMPIETPAVRP